MTLKYGKMLNKKNASALFTQLWKSQWLVCFLKHLLMVQISLMCYPSHHISDWCSQVTSAPHLLTCDWKSRSYEIAGVFVVLTGKHRTSSIHVCFKMCWGFFCPKNSDRPSEPPMWPLESPQGHLLNDVRTFSMTPRTVSYFRHAVKCSVWLKTLSCCVVTLWWLLFGKMNAEVWVKRSHIRTQRKVAMFLLFSQILSFLSFSLFLPINYSLAPPSIWTQTSLYFARPSLTHFLSSIIHPQLTAAREPQKGETSRSDSDMSDALLWLHVFSFYRLKTEF